MSYKHELDIVCIVTVSLDINEQKYAVQTKQELIFFPAEHKHIS